MTYEELVKNYRIEIVTEERLAECEPFSCDNEDLDDFFSNNAVTYGKHLLGKTYQFCLKETPNIVACAFTLSNDSIRITNKFHDDYKDKFLNDTNLSEKGLRRYPAVLIGRLGTDVKFAGQGFGSAVLCFIKTWVQTKMLTGCRFLIADAYNTPNTIRFYQKNDFHFLIEDERLEAKYMGIGVGRLPLNTRLMYYDLIDMQVE